LLREWAVCMGVDEEEARDRMQDILHKSTAQA
jgi:hypothetical protein